MKHLFLLKAIRKGLQGSSCQIVSFLFLLLSFSHLYSQVTVTHTIDYSFVSLSTCNVFATDPVVDNYNHQSVYGFPNYNTTESAVGLTTLLATGFPNSAGVTAYGIKYPFKKGYTYSVSVYARATQPSGTSVPGFIALSITPNLPGTSTNNISCGDYMVEPLSNFN